MLLCGLVFLFTHIIPIGGGLFSLLALHNIGSPEFKVFQVVTHVFTHGGFTHLLFNMMGLFFFGAMLERVWGEKKFFIFFMATGIGAGLHQVLHSLLQVNGGGFRSDFRFTFCHIRSLSKHGVDAHFPPYPY